VGQIWDSGPGVIHPHTHFAGKMLLAGNLKKNGSGKIYKALEILTEKISSIVHGLCVKNRGVKR